MTDAHRNYIPYKVFEPRNLGNTPSYVYLGKSISDDLDKTKSVTVRDKEKLSENCYTTFLWASLVGGKGIRIDPPTRTDPYTFIDQKWFDLRPFKYWLSWQKNARGPIDGEKYFEYIEELKGKVDETLPYNNALAQRDVFENDVDPVYYIRRIISDGSVIVNANNGRFFWGSDGKAHGEESNINPTDEIELQAHEYRVECVQIEETDESGTFEIRLGDYGDTASKTVNIGIPKEDAYGVSLTAYSAVSGAPLTGLELSNVVGWVADDESDSFQANIKLYPPITDELNASPFDRILVQWTTSEGICPIVDVQQDGKHKGITYTFSNFEPKNGVVIYEHDRVTRESGIIPADFSKLIPPGVMILGMDTECEKLDCCSEKTGNECCVGEGDIQTGGGFFVNGRCHHPVQDLSGVGTRLLNPSSQWTDKVIHLDTDSLRITLRTVYPECYSGTSAYIVWSSLSDDAIIVEKDKDSLKRELTAYWGFPAGSESLDDESFNALLVAANSSYSGPITGLSGITNVQESISSQEVVDLLFFDREYVSATVELIMVYEVPNEENPSDPLRFSYTFRAYIENNLSSFSSSKSSDSSSSSSISSKSSSSSSVSSSSSNSSSSVSSSSTSSISSSSSNSSNSSSSSSSESSSRSSSSSQSSSSSSGSSESSSFLTDNVIVEFFWYEDCFDLDSRVDFLSNSVGVFCGDTAPYMTFDVDDRGEAGYERATIFTDTALGNGAWTGSVNIDLYADWWDQRGTPGEAGTANENCNGQLTVRVTHKFSQEEQTIHVCSTNDDCPENYIGTLTVFDTGVISFPALIDDGSCI